jgi:hypothetical protein
VPRRPLLAQGEEAVAAGGRVEARDPVYYRTSVHEGNACRPARLGHGAVRPEEDEAAASPRGVTQEGDLGVAAARGREMGCRGPQHSEHTVPHTKPPSLAEAHLDGACRSVRMPPDPPARADRAPDGEGIGGCTQ